MTFGEKVLLIKSLVLLTAIVLGYFISRLLANKIQESIRYVPSFLAGAVLQIVFSTYFGEMNWIFASNYGSDKGSALSLIIFLLGFLIINECSRYIRTSSPKENIESAPILISIVFYQFFLGACTTASEFEYITASALTVFFESLIIFICIYRIYPKRWLLTLLAAASARIFGMMIVVSQTDMPNEISLAGVGALVCAMLLYGAISLFRNKNISYISIILGFCVMEMI